MVIGDTWAGRPDRSRWTFEEDDQGDSVRPWDAFSTSTTFRALRNAAAGQGRLGAVQAETPVGMSVHEVLMTRQRCLLSWAAAVGMIATLSAQAPRPTFEVVSVRKADASKTDSAGLPVLPRRYPLDSEIYEPPYATVGSLITFAYNLSWRQVVGGPDWIGLDHFEVRARSARPTSEDEKRLMVQSLLEDRFGLVAHAERRTMRFGSLVLARDDRQVGEGLTLCDDPNESAGLIPVPRGGEVFAQRCGPLSGVANKAAAVFDLPVVDRTGLTGSWNVLVTYAASRPLPPGIEADPNLASFPTALEEQLGVKVETSVGPLDVLVIDSIQQPTEN